MPWSNQSGNGGGGGPWGQGPRGPWGQGPQGPNNGPNPPDLDDVIRRAQAQLNRFLPSGNGGGRGIFLLLAAGLLVIWVFNSAFTVQPDEVGIVTRFGAYQAPPRQPGLNFILWPVEQVQTVKVTRVNQEEIGFRSRGNGRQEVPDEALMLTKDENIVSVGFTVSWSVRADRPQDFVFKIMAPQDAVRAVAESAMREVVGRNTAEDIITRGQAILQSEVTRILQETLDSYNAGIQINALSVARPEVPPQVREAFNDVQQAAQDAQTFQNQSRRDANQLLADARADAVQRLQEADSFAKRIAAEAQGEASRFLAVFEQYKNAKDVTRQRIYLETMERILSNANKTIIDSGPSNSGVIPYLPLPELRPQPQTTGSKP